MITPIVKEDAWAQALEGLPCWTPPERTTLVIAPHPDDETLGAGGLIASLRERGCPVQVLAVTDGENCYAGEDPRQERIAEQTAALGRLGVRAEDICRLHLPDSGLHKCEVEVAEGISRLLTTKTHLIAPWEHDFHPDHEVCGRAARAVATAHQIPITSYLFWTWHRGTPALFQELQAVRFECSAQQQQAKREALALHRSQLEHPSGEPILPEYLLHPVWRTYEVFLPS